MSTPFLIRDALSTDYERVCALFAEVDSLHAERAPWMFRTPLAEPRSPEFFAALLQNADCRLMVADAGELAGVATVLLRTAPELGIFVPQHWGVLDNIAVARAWRRRGVGSALTRAAEAWALARGAQWLELSVYDFNADARAFYDSIGYVPASHKLRKVLRE